MKRRREEPVARYQIYLDKAYDAIDRRAYAEAIQWCKRAIDVDPSAPEAYAARGEALDGSGMWEEALQSFDRALERDPHFIEAMLSKAEILADIPERAEEALAVCTEADALLAEGDPEDFLLAESFYIRGRAYFALDRWEDALVEYDRALELSPKHQDYLTEKGILLYQLAEWESAEQVLREALELDPQNPDLHYTLGLLLEKVGRESEAKQSFEAATRSDPARHPPILAVSREQFSMEVERALASLPEQFSRHLVNVAVIIEDFPSRAFLEETGLDPQMLGLFEGKTQLQHATGTAMGVASGASQLPSRVLLFQRNIEKVCESESDLVQEIRITLMHEIGHFFGMSEDDLRALGLD
jgi:predicted Zn-dependent protease with MMP-like domain